MRQNPINKDENATKLKKTKFLFTKSLSPKYDLTAGTILTRSMLTLKKPSGGFTNDDFDKVIGKKLKNPISAKRILRPYHLE